MYLIFIFTAKTHHVEHRANGAVPDSAAPHRWHGVRRGTETSKTCGPEGTEFGTVDVMWDRVAVQLSHGPARLEFGGPTLRTSCQRCGAAELKFKTKKLESITEKNL